MSDIELTVAVLLIAGLAVVGIGAITRGWTPLVRRHSIARPRLWGYGMLVSDAGLAAFVFCGPFQSPGDSRLAPFAVVGGIVAAAGVLVQSAAARPTNPTKNAS
ncbi:hypothetical protein R6V09_41640 [Streptomyces sp. W16]|uniref:hypothetical protein n=1 Tax=Streptomyces sp. W16 TaxID=3076631 RepID=UPI00295AE2AB|nr:hypothetical protein [Streptomyces sp. W16]MDV9176617.1 hypothetical protein [Streptomyces sp. W16]